ncbi:MAG TPA: TlpA disulfide reductase family protein [Acidimicrobiales bacterium]|nr:TlpA disulfide reductase family protein [Acidimicrobiales bacterium]
MGAKHKKATARSAARQSPSPTKGQARPRGRPGAITASRRRRRSGPGRATVAVGVGAVALIAVIALAVGNRSSSRGYDTQPSAFVLPALSGPGKVALASFRGRPVVVNFFASWCTVCASELPVFAHDALALRGEVDVVEVNSLETGNGAAFARQYGLAAAVTAVAQDVGGSQGDGLYQALGGTGSMPMTAFFNAQGQLITNHIGGYNATTLAGALHHFYGLSVPG